jgi:5-methylcytosine-specific restriction protein A
MIVHPADRLPIEVLNAAVPGVHWDRLQGSGVEVRAQDARRLEDLWQAHAAPLPFRSPEEVAETSRFEEGAAIRVIVNRYERDQRARAACIAHWGVQCVVCNMDFVERYGPLGQGFIHVHHLRELSSVGRDYLVDPVADLRPVCPNCHAMLHRTSPAMSVEDLQSSLMRG